MNLKLVTWNIWCGKYLDEIIAFLGHSDADIIALQEVVQELDGKNNTAKTIAQAIGYNWRYGETAHFAIDGNLLSWGNAILSKHPILDDEVYKLSSIEARTAIRCAVQTGNTILHVFSAHFLHTHQQSSLEQDQQSENLLKVIPNQKSVLMGDFNALPTSYPITKLSHTLRNADLGFNPTAFTTPEGCPECSTGDTSMCLDYIFTTKDISVHSARVDISKASDHLPLTAIVQV